MREIKAVHPTQKLNTIFIVIGNERYGMEAFDLRHWDDGADASDAGTADLADISTIAEAALTRHV